MVTKPTEVTAGSSPGLLDLGKCHMVNKPDVLIKTLGGKYGKKITPKSLQSPLPAAVRAFAPAIEFKIPKA